MNSAEIEALFTTPTGFRFARWGRPVAPVLFGLADESLEIIGPAIRAVCADAGVPMAETDPDSGANLIGFFTRDWADLAAIPDLAQLTGQPDLPARLAAENARSYRLFRLDAAGAIRACFTFHRIADDHPAALAEALAVNALITFAREVTPTPAIAALLRAAYDPRLPAASPDPALALRLAARLSV